MKHSITALVLMSACALTGCATTVTTATDSSTSTGADTVDPNVAEMIDFLESVPRAANTLPTDEDMAAELHAAYPGVEVQASPRKTPKNLDSDAVEVSAKVSADVCVIGKLYPDGTATSDTTSPVGGICLLGEPTV